MLTIRIRKIKKGEKMTKTVLIALLILTTINAEKLTTVQKDKLNSSLVKNQDNNLVIEEYNIVNFSTPVLFEQSKINQLIIKTYATMPKNTIHKEQFIAFCSTLSDQMIQSIIFAPHFSPYLLSSTLLTSKPKKSVQLTIELLFTLDGIDSKIYSKNQNIASFIPYSDIFHMKFK